VQATVPVELPCRDAGPPAPSPIGAEFRGDLEGGPGTESEHADGAPLTGEDQFGVAVAVQIAEDRAAHDARILQVRRPGGLEAAPGVEKEARWPRDRVSARARARADKQVRITVAIDIGHRERTEGRTEVRPEGFEAREAVVRPHHEAPGPWFDGFVMGLRDEDP